MLQPRLGVSYLVKRTNTVLRASYTRNFETPYNENLILSSATGAGGLGNGILGDTSNLPLSPGRRNQFNFGFQQSLGSHLLVDGDYFYKRTNNAYDFNVLFNTSVTFPISWQTSKLDGVSARINLTNYKGLSAFMVAGHTRARYFPRRVAACSSIRICLQASSALTTIRLSSRQRRCSTSSNNGRGLHHISPSLGATIVVWCQEQCLISTPH